MMGVRKSWFGASLQDEAFSLVMLAHYAARISLRTKVGDPLESLTLRMEANRIVNERLNSVGEGISHGTIAAVASLCYMRCVLSSHEKFLSLTAE